MGPSQSYCDAGSTRTLVAPRPPSAPTALILARVADGAHQPTEVSMSADVQKPDGRARWVLLALADAGAAGLTPVQLQKALFLLGRRRAADVGAGFYQFEPYHYGPFDAAVYHDAESLAANGLIVIDANGGRRLRRYTLTAAGLQAVAAAIVPPSARAYVRDVVPWVQRLSFSELVRAVYEAYPEMRARSVFRG